MANFDKLAQEISEIGKKLYNNGFAPGLSGNISIKSEEGILITTSGVNLGNIYPQNVVLIDIDSNPLAKGKKPSSEKFTHTEIYRKRPDISAIIHCHATKSSAFAVAGIPLNSPILAENIFQFGEIPIAEYALPSTKELAENIAELFHDHDVVLMANHGVVIGGKTLIDVYYQLETLEHYAEVFLLSKLLGKANELPPNEVEKILALRKTLLS